jgi:hypothetical protein
VGRDLHPHYTVHGRPVALVMHTIAPILLKELLVVAIVMVLLLPGCQNAAVQENDHLREEIIRVHDLAMEKIGYMYELEVKLEDLSVADRDTEDEIKKAISHLQTANTMMFDWMHQYQTLAVESTLEKDNEYRSTQLLMITKVQQQTDRAIQISEKLLNHQQ